MTPVFAVLLADGTTARRFSEPDGSPPFPNAGEAIVDTLELPDDLPPYARVDWAARTILTGPQEAEAWLVAQVDTRRAGANAAELGTDLAKQWEYQRKGAEALSDIGPWLWLQREAEEKGVTIEDVRLGVLEAMDASERHMSGVAAVAVAGKVAIRAAETVADKQAAFDAIQWPKKEPNDA